MSSWKRTSWDAWGSIESFDASKKQKRSTLEGFMVIGLDFGTTYSGAAWGTLADFESSQINLVTSWPGTGREESKAPTEIYYDGDRTLWGYSIPADAEPLRWFKLLLLRDSDLTPEMKRSNTLSQTNTILEEKKKTATDVIADYLRGFWKHTIITIERARSKPVIDALKFHVVITVPAIWPDYARKSMTEAARKAGIFDYRASGTTTLVFAPEPEAAALASLWDRVSDLKKEDVYMICDAGGGTVDLISYRVGSADPIQLHEAVVGTGGLCGGIFIDEQFEAMCKSRLGRRWRNLTQAGVKDIMKHEWESGVKPQFNADDEAMEYIVAVPAEAFSGKGVLGLTDVTREPHIKNGRIHFTSSNIKSAFDSAFHDIQALINSQMGEAKQKGLSIKGIILVGGLGSSPYLYQYLRDKYTKEGVEILQSTGSRPRTAICRGAIFKGFLEGPTAQDLETDSRILRRVSIVSTIARKSLGICFDIRFRKSIHDRRDKEWDSVEGMWMATNQMSWYLRKGDNVTRKSPVREELYRSYASREAFETDDQPTNIYECSDSIPPSRATANVVKLCSIRPTLDGIKYADLDDFTGRNGKKLKRWCFEVEMMPSGASTEFAIYYRGEKVGSQHVAIEFQ